MAVPNHPQQCPACGSREFNEFYRVEAGRIGYNEDAAMYHCEACCYEWDSTEPINRMHPDWDGLAPVKGPGR